MVTHLTTTVIPVSSPRRMSDYRPKHDPEEGRTTGRNMLVNIL